MAHVDWPCWPSATVPLAHPGLLVADRYRLLNQVGVGAMGTVWLATDQRLNRQVALKQVVLEPGLDPRQASEARQRILREGRIAARLQHPHAVAIYDVTMQDGEPWLVMEYLRARTLAAVLTMDGPLADRTAARIGAQLADALDVAHHAGIVHRDVKPGNVLVCADGMVKLADFGIARASGDITVTQTGVLAGTPEYFAPEVAGGGPPSPAADVFSLGATLYASVEGRPPFDLDGDAFAQLDVVAAGRTQPFRRASWLGPVLSLLLEADPQRRPTAGQARALLSEAGPYTGRIPPTPPGRVPPPRTGDRPGIPAPSMPSNGANHLSGGSGMLPRLPGPRRPDTPAHRRRWLLGGLAAVALFTATTAATTALTEGGISATAISPTGGTVSAPVRPASESELTEAVRAYYDLLPAAPVAAWQRLTSKAHEQLGDATVFTNYWRGIGTVRLLGTSVSTSDHTVRAQVQLQTRDGQARSVYQRLVLTPSPRGEWLIDEFTTG